jgi:hypothetical protein
MSDKRYFVDVFGAIMTYIREYYDPLIAGVGLEKPYYLHGHPLDILQMLNQKDKNPEFKYKKYPLIALLQDFTENDKDVNPQFEYIVSPRVLIITSTSQAYDSIQRYTNTFKPILYPLYKLLLDAIDDSIEIFECYEDYIPHTKIDRMYWGKTGVAGNEGLTFNDHLDCIEINFTDLHIFKETSCLT